MRVVRRKPLKSGLLMFSRPRVYLLFPSIEFFSTISTNQSCYLEVDNKVLYRIDEYSGKIKRAKFCKEIICNYLLLHAFSKISLYVQNLYLP